MKRATELVNEIVAVAKPGGISPSRPTKPIRSFGIGDRGVSFFQDNLAIFTKNIHTLFESNESVRETYTLKKFESEFMSSFGEFCRTGDMITEKTCEEFFDRLLLESVKNFYVLRDVYGLSISNTDEPFVIGPFTIYEFESHANRLNARTKVEPNHLWHNPPTYLIEHSSSARHFEKAVEIADKFFELFERIATFAIGYASDRFEVGIIHYEGRSLRSAYVFDDDGGFSSSYSSHGAFEPIPIDDPYFTSQEIGLDRLWGIVCKTSKTEFEKRLLLAAEWLGQAYTDKSRSTAFIKSAISLEVLLSHQEKTIINPSILSQISESVALVLGDSVDSRKEIEKEMKRLYSRRSAVAHSGAGNISDEDLGSIYLYSRVMLTTLLSEQPFNKVNSVAELHRFLKENKYSGPSFLDWT